MVERMEKEAEKELSTSQARRKIAKKEKKKFLRVDNLEDIDET